MTIIILTVRAELSKVSGKFTSKDELADELIQAVESADPGSLDPTGEGEYEVTDWSVSQA